MSAPGPNPARCPHCQAEVYWSDATQCWMCGQALGGPGPSVRPPPPPAAAARRTFGLSSVMLLIALLAVCLGVWREVPWLGIVLAVTVAPVLVWTMVMVSRSKAEQGRPLPVLEKVGVFFFALVAVVVIWVAALIAFVITCFPIGAATLDMSGSGPGGFFLACGVGGVAAIAAGYGTYRLFRWAWRSWRRKG